MWDGGYVSGTNETDTRPSDLPADHDFVRGTGAAPGSYSADGAWFGSTLVPDRVNIGCRDASGTGDESFWIITKGTGLSYTSTGNADHGRLAFEAVSHESGLGIADANPYAWWTPASTTGNWLEGMDDLRCILTEDDAGGTQGRWRRLWNAGQGTEEIKRYGSGQQYQGDTFGANNGDNPGWESAGDQAIYQATPQLLLRRVHLTKSLELAFRDSEGGWTSNILFSNQADSNNLDTFASGAYAKFGNWLVVWWDGNPANPPVE